MTRLEQALKPMSSRMKLQRTAEWAVIGLLVGMIGALLMRIASFLWLFPKVWLWSAVSFCGVPLLCALISWVWPIAVIDAARKVDAAGLEARLQTALMLKESSTPMAELQRQDALKHLETVNPKQIFPLKLSRILLLSTLTCMLAYGLSFLIPNPQESVLSARAAFQQEMTKQAELLDEGAVKLDATEPQTPELRKILSDLSMELRKAEEPRTALNAVDEAERRIERLQAATREDALSAMENKGMSDVATALENGDEETAKQLLSQQNEQNAANALNQAARAAVDAAAAQSLTQAAQAMQSGDLTAALNALQSAAAGTSSVTLQAAALNNMVRMAAAAVGSSQMAMMTGTGSQNGQGGAGSSAIAALTGGGSGAGKGSSNKDGGYREANGLSATTPTQEGSLTLEDYESIYDPTRLNREGESVQTKGKIGEGEISEITAGAGLGTVEESVPYRQVITEYEETAVTAAQNADLPLYAQKWVQDYFSALSE
ncbi:MAG: hypothetical protein PHI98_05715 [Eubacteriales bacterium]|nr:hypothetical protein [Eubacteriales bacterium]